MNNQTNDNDTYNNWIYFFFNIISNIFLCTQLCIVREYIISIFAPIGLILILVNLLILLLNCKWKVRQHFILLLGTFQIFANQCCLTIWKFCQSWLYTHLINLLFDDFGQIICSIHNYLLQFSNLFVCGNITINKFYNQKMPNFIVPF